MPDTLSRLAGPMDIPSGSSTLFTGTASHVYTIKTMTIVNATGSSINCSIGINGTSNSHLILPYTSIDAGGRAEFSGLEVLTGTETLHATTSADGLTFTMAGLDQG